jgi:hypothetical protein
MTSEPTPIEPSTDAEQIIPPEQPPMDEAAGGPQADKSEKLEDTSTDDLSVQGGE